MSSTNDDSKTTKSRTTAKSRESAKADDKTDAQTPEASQNETKDEMALAVQNGPDKSLSLKMHESDLPGHRPITVSQHEVAATFGASGEQRPIFASTLAVSGMIHSSGDRPISASTLVVSESYSLMGGKRPIASNAIDDDPDTLMGYLD
ncbi:MAG TPA: hypothetical protein IGS17_03385 [Oscillatoriales cyanobacterium M59_W2019_021]|nr:hypothetical protein [Oscillatoriales cyanobacterium M4454_W2019_049]HIK49956.1 hypothetical protein [Oscillatoriales cyanobacterium M59_W2019_021]